MKVYEIFYRERGNKGANVTSTTVEANSKKQALEGFDYWDNGGKEETEAGRVKPFTVVKITLANL